jgi:hypothetical protein
MADNTLAEIVPSPQVAYSSAKTDSFMPSWSEEAIISEQFFSAAKDSAAVWSGERRLLLAVLQDAVASFLRYCKDPARRGRRLFRETHEWFWSTDRQWLCAFESICDNLHLNASYIRRGLNRYSDPAAFVSLPSPVEQQKFPRETAPLTVVRRRGTPENGDRASW